jgi:hypothetical protein
MRLAACVHATLLLLLLLPAAAVAQERPANRARVSGRVTGPEDKPVGGARISLQETTRGGPVLNTLTDEEGQFSFTQLPAGLYVVSASKPGYVTRAAEGEEAAEPAPLRVEDGAEVADVRLSLEKGGVITGRVGEEGGGPVVLANVEVSEPPGALRRYRPNRFQNFTTDDRGVYRLFGLPPGRYLLKVTLYRPSGRQQEMAAFYYPGVESPREATPVEVTAGGEVKDVDVTVRPRRDAGKGIIHGRVARSDGTPLSQYPVWVFSDGALPVRATTVPLDDGTYEFKNLPAGSYTVEVSTQDQRLVERARAAVLLKESGQAEANLTVESASSVAGWFEHEDGTRLARSAGLSVTAFYDNGMQQARAVLTGNGQFNIARLPPGPVQLRAHVGGGQLYVVKILQQQAELTDGRLIVDPGAQVGGVRVVVSKHGGTLRGSVTGGGGKGVVAGAWVSVVPTEYNPGNPFGAMQHARADHRGEFVIPAVPPGSYFVLSSRNPRLLPGNPAMLYTWIEGRGEAVTKVQVKAREQQQLLLRVLD